MRPIFKPVLFVVLAVSFTTAMFAQNDMLKYVDPFIGTAKSSMLTKWGNEGGTFPGAVAPSGYLQLTPETRRAGTTGYDFNDSTISVFSCLHHNSGFPNGSAGGLYIMPVEASKNFEPFACRRSFSHKKEKAEPGYYNVLFTDNNTLVEAAATQRAGLFRFSFPAHVLPQIFVGQGGEINMLGDSIVTGSWFNSVMMFNKKISKKVPSGNGYLLQFDTVNNAASVITVSVSASGVGIKNALRNIDIEIGDKSIEAIAQSTKALWAKALAKVDIADTNVENRKIFYTALYHSLLIPWIISDVDGNYSGRDGQIHKASGDNEYGNFSPWDTFRTLNPLRCFLYPEIEKDVVLSMLDIYKQRGRLPIESMTGNHAIAIIVDAYLKGLVMVDSLLVYAAIKSNMVDTPFIQNDIAIYHQLGYIPFSYPESVTRTVEYAYDDWVIAQFAKTIMHDETAYAIFIKRSEAYRELFNPQTLLLLPRKEDVFKINPGTTGYKEGDAWAYSYFVPHNTKGLVNLMGGNSYFTQRLDSALANNTIIFDNETVFDVPYLFNESGAPYKTQQWVRSIMANRFKALPGGLPGNDDLGSTSSWFVWSAMGIYPFTPGRPTYTIGSPLFHKMVIHLTNNKELTIERVNDLDNGIYVKSLSMNNKKYGQLFLPHSLLADGGNLIFEMASKPVFNAFSAFDKYAFSETKTDADIRITHYSTSKKVVLPNELLWVKFTLQNDGSIGTKQVKVFVNGKESAYKNCMLAATATITDSIACKAYAFGKCSIILDTLKPLTIAVVKSKKLQPTLAVTQLTATPVIKFNEEQHLSFLAQNIDGITRTFKIPLLLNDVVFDTKSISLPPGEFKMLSAVIKHASDGLQTITVNKVSAKYKVYKKPEEALVMDLPMQNADGNALITDHSGFNNNGNLIQTKQENQAKNLSGILVSNDRYIEVSNAASLDILGESISMMAWVFPLTNQQGSVDIFTKGDHHVLQVVDGNKLSFFAGGWGRGDVTVNLPAKWNDHWHHIAGVCDGNSLKLYIDGALAGTTMLEEHVNLSVTNKWNLGRNEEFPGTRIFKGYMMEAKVFAAALTEQEVIKTMGKPK